MKTICNFALEISGYSLGATIKMFASWGSFQEAEIHFYQGEGPTDRRANTPGWLIRKTPRNSGNKTPKKAQIQNKRLTYNIPRRFRYKAVKKA